MAELARLNGVIRAFEQGQTAFAAFSPAEIDAALAFSTASYDAIVFEMEHNPWDARILRDCLQYMINRRQIVDSGSIAPESTDRKSTRLNSSHSSISYAVFCLKKKKKNKIM